MNRKKYSSWLNPSPEKGSAPSTEVPRSTKWRYSAQQSSAERESLDDNAGDAEVSASENSIELVDRDGDTGVSQQPQEISPVDARQSYIMDSSDCASFHPVEETNAALWSKPSSRTLSTASQSEAESLESSEEEEGTSTASSSSWHVPAVSCDTSKTSESDCESLAELDLSMSATGSPHSALPQMKRRRIEGSDSDSEASVFSASVERPYYASSVSKRSKIGRFGTTSNVSPACSPASSSTTTSSHTQTLRQTVSQADSSNNGDSNDSEYSVCHDPTDHVQELRSDYHVCHDSESFIDEYEGSAGEVLPSSPTQIDSDIEESLVSQDNIYPAPPSPSEVEEDDPLDLNQRDEIITQNGVPNGGRFTESAGGFQFLKKKLDLGYRSVIKEKPQISCGELLLNAMTLNNHFHLNFTQFEGVMKLINSIFKAPVVPDTRYKLDVLFKSSVGTHFHFVCFYCRSHLGELDHSHIKQVTCKECSSLNQISDLNKALFFVIYDLPTQIEILFSDPNVAHSLKNPHNLGNDSDPLVLKDVYDGTMYQSFISSLGQPDPHVKHFSLCFSIDGAALYQSSASEIYPIFCCLLELPPSIRMHNLLLAGLWFGKTKPMYDVFLTPFLEHCQQLSRGFSISVGQEEWTMKGHLISCCADAPARAAVQCVHQHNGSFGCNWCLHPTTYQNHRNLYLNFDYAPSKRSISELIRDGTRTLAFRQKDKTVNGVTGISPCISVKTALNIVDGLILEYFHALTHGIAKQLSGGWFGDDTAEAPYYIGSPAILKKINAILLAIRAPIEARRPARDVNEFAKWKGRDFENFILYFSVPVLLNILPQIYLKHWVLFVQAFHLLLQREVPLSHVNLARELITEFVTKVQSLYGEDHMTYNVHIATHLPDNVQRWGPLWSINGYCFESGNRDVKSTIHASRGIASQVCRSLSQVLASKVLEANASSSSSKKFRRDIEKSTVDKYISFGEDKFFGKVSSFTPTSEELWLFRQRGVEVQNFVEVEKLLHCGCIYSNSVKTSLKTNNSVASLSTNGSFFLIKKIIVNEETEECYLVGRKLTTAPCLVPPGVNDTDAFLRVISFTGHEPVIVLPSDLFTVCARITTPHGDFVIRVPNTFNTC